MPIRLVKDVIAHRGFPTVQPKATIDETARVMKRLSSSAVLVIQKKKLLGICTERDIVFRVIAEGRDPCRTLVEAAMTQMPRVITSDRPFAHALHLMYEGGFRHVPVVACDGQAVGLLCATDALGSDCRELEEELVQREDIAAVLG